MQNTKYVSESTGLCSNLSQISTPLLNAIENVQLGVLFRFWEINLMTSGGKKWNGKSTLFHAIYHPCHIASMAPAVTQNNYTASYVVSKSEV